MSHNHRHCHDAHGHIVTCPITLEPIRRGHEIEFNKQLYDRHAMRDWTHSQIVHGKTAATIPHSRRALSHDEMYHLHAFHGPSNTQQKPWHHHVYDYMVGKKLLQNNKELTQHFRAASHAHHQATRVRRQKLDDIHRRLMNLGPTGHWRLPPTDGFRSRYIQVLGNNHH